MSADRRPCRFCYTDAYVCVAREGRTGTPCCLECAATPRQPLHPIGADA